MESNMCDVCLVPAKQSCSSCHEAFYCSKECQKKAWKKHKSSCIPYVIQVHPVYGRYVVATRDIEAGEVVMREYPVAVGPPVPSKPLCLGCHKPVNGSYACSKCNIPLCSSSCEKSIYHETECHVLSQATKVIKIESFEEINPAYEFILPLRCLLLKYTDPKKWKILNTMQDSLEKTTEEWRMFIQNNIIDYFTKYMNFKGVDENDLFRICGIMHTNSFEIEHNGNCIEGLFPKVALMAHDCSPNTENIYDKTLRISVRATRAIPKGASVTTTYTYLLWNTFQRRNHLLNAKFFDCMCQRCSDPTELGTHFGTLVCSQCGGQVLSTEPLKSENVWRCKDCNFSIDSTNVDKAHRILRKSFEVRDRTQIRPLEDLIDLCNNRLHSQNQIPMEAKFAWIKFCGNHPDYRYKDLSKAQLQLKISYCYELLKVGDAILPGRTQFRGVILYELHACLKAMGVRLLSFGEFNKMNVQEYLTESEERLKESMEIFCFEDEMKTRGLEKKLALLKEEFEDRI